MTGVVASSGNQSVGRGTATLPPLYNFTTATGTAGIASIAVANVIAEIVKPLLTVVGG